MSAVFYNTSVNVMLSFRSIKKVYFSEAVLIFVCVNVDRPSAPRRWGSLVNMERVMARL